MSPRSGPLPTSSRRVQQKVRLARSAAPEVGKHRIDPVMVADKRAAAGDVPLHVVGAQRSDGASSPPA
jgi:hypothetical protein